MIRLNLEISDPTRSDGPKLLALAALFTQLAQGTAAEQTRDALGKPKSAERVVGASPALAAPYAGQLDAADNPAAGMPSPTEAFGTTMGNGAAGSGSASSPSLASTGAGSTSATDASSATGAHSAATAASLPDPAVAFGGNSAPNVPPVPARGAGSAAISTPSTGSLPPVAPSAPSAAGAPAGVELDSEGIPWDASIHASTKVKIANGTWKVKRGTGEAYLLERKAQLKAAVSVGNAAPAGAPATPPANVSPPAPVAGAPVPPPPGNVQAPAAGASTTPQASQQTTPGTAGSSPVTLAQVMPRVTAAISAGTLTVDSAAAIVRELSEGKIDNVAMLAVAPALLPAFVARLDALGVPA